MTLTIRRAESTDLTAIATLHATNWRMTYRGMLSDHYLDVELDHDRLTDWQNRFAVPPPHQYVVVAEDDRRNLVGFACAYGRHDPEVGTLVENLHAHPTHRKAGIGKALLAHVASWSAENFPGDAMHLWVLRANVAAIGFYRHMGAVADQDAIWDAPGGGKVPELRFTWHNPSTLMQNFAAGTWVVQAGQTYPDQA